MIIDTGEAQIHVNKAGVGEPLLLIHGLGMSAELWVSVKYQRLSTF